MVYAVWHGLAADESSNNLKVLQSPDVTVTDKSDGSTPQLYADRDGNTALGNPFTANQDGSITFYVAAGRYKVEASKDGSTVTWDNELLIVNGTAPDEVPTNADIDSRGFAQSVDSTVDLRNGSFPSSLERIWLSGYSGIGTAGGGSLYRDSSDTSSRDNGATVFVDADGVRWKPSVGFLVGDHVEVTIPTDYSSLQDALDDLSRIYADARGTSGLYDIVVKIESGTTLASRTTISSQDLSYIIIKSEDATVPIDPSVIPAGGYAAFFEVKNGGTSPRFAVVFDGQQAGDTDEGIAGFRASSQSRFTREDSVVCGFKNLNGRGLYVVESSVAHVRSGDFRGNYTGMRASNTGRIFARSVDVSDCGGTAIQAVGNAIITVGAGTGTNGSASNDTISARSNSLIQAEQFNGANSGGVGADEGGRINVQDADFSGSGQYGISCTNGAEVYGEACNVSGAAGRGVYVNRGSASLSNVNASSAGSEGIRCVHGVLIANNGDVSGAASHGLHATDSQVSAEAINATSCTGAGIKAESSYLSAKGADVSNGGSYGLHNIGAQCLVAGITATSTGSTAIRSEQGGYTVAQNGSAKVADGSDGIQIFEGSILNAIGVTTDGGSPSAGDTNFSSFNTIESNNGIIWG